MVVLLATDIVVATAPPERAGTASALSETSNEFGGAIGIALLGTIALTVYGREVEFPAAEGLVPEDLAADARDTLPAALQVARSLPKPAADAMREGAINAFTGGMQVAVLVGSTLLLVVAAFAMLALRSVQSVGTAAASADTVTARDPFCAPERTARVARDRTSGGDLFCRHRHGRCR